MKDPFLVELAARMRAVRQSKGWSLQKAEEHTGIHTVVLGSYERADRNPTLPQARRWVEAFGRTLVVLEPDEIVVGDDRALGQYVTYHVVTAGGVELDRETRAAAEVLARDIPGAKVGYRVVRRGPLEFDYRAGEM